MFLKQAQEVPTNAPTYPSFDNLQLEEPAGKQQRKTMECDWKSECVGYLILLHMGPVQSINLRFITLKSKFHFLKNCSLYKILIHNIELRSATSN
jgi:hypothetical protein